MISPDIAKHTRLVLFAACAPLLAALPVRGQAPPARPGEIQVVARISKQFIEDVATRSAEMSGKPNRKPS